MNHLIKNRQSTAVTGDIRCESEGTLSRHPRSSPFETKVTARAGLMSLLVGLGFASSQNASALGAGDADMFINGFNNSFLVTSGSQAYYKNSINSNGAESSWGLALEIMAMQDAYERTGSTAHRTLVNNLCTTFLINNSPSGWAGNKWNDDIGWMTMALVRGYQMTGTANFLTQARYGFDMAWARGWDTVYNGGGIWELQPEEDPNPNKQPLSNNTLGKVACMIYQSNGDVWYRDRAIQIYAWSRSHLFNPSTGQVYQGIDRNGTVNTSANVYNQGTFIDYANLLWKITGDSMYYNDAIMAVNYVRNNMTTGGIINDPVDWHLTWQDEFARGLGHLCKDNAWLWGTYHSWMVQNADAIVARRRTDRNLTWNLWAQQTPIDNNQSPAKFISAVAMMQFTPVSSPWGGVGGPVASGTYRISPRHATGSALDAAGTANGADVVQWGYNGGNNQRWSISHLGSNQYCMIGVASGRALEVAAASTADGANVLIWGYSGGNHQKWTLSPTSGGYYNVRAVHSGKALDVVGGLTGNGTNVDQWTYGGGNHQQWIFQAP